MEGHYWSKPMKSPNQCIKDNDADSAMALHKALVTAGFSASERIQKLKTLSAADGGFDENAFYALVVKQMSIK